MPARPRKITSVSNPIVKEAVLIGRRKQAFRDRSFLIEGIKTLSAAVQAGASISAVFLSETFAGREEVHEMMTALPPRAAQLYEVSEHVLSKISGLETPPGIIATVSVPHLQLADLACPPTMLLAIVDGVQDPGNLGSLLRTADASGCDAVVVLPGTCDPYMQKAVRATAGSIFNVPVVLNDAKTCIEWLKNRSIRLVVTSPRSTTVVFGADLSGRIALVLGNEAHGVSEEVRRSADMTLQVPIYGKAESLNVTAAAAVCLYEAARQRKTRLQAENS